MTALAPSLRRPARGACACACAASVQGVGFRPPVYGLATRLGFRGFVLNDAEGVLIEIEGAGAEQFVHALRLDPPPLARIDSLDVAELPLAGGARLRHRREQGRASR